MKTTTALATALLILGTASAQSAPLDALAAAEQQAQSVWEAMPLTVRATALITEASPGYGIYTARPTDVFKPGEPIFTYIEPVGYGWAARPDGQFDVLFNVDMKFLSQAGDVLAEQKNFGNIVITSHNRPHEASLWLSVTPTGAPAGKYRIEYTIHDGSSDEMTTVTQDAEIVAE